ncbi:MAG: flagellar biosynthesis anti-sigma factor FlgM [Syntrophorhabdales bacterium]|jgi:negative regulator of flagellin synthesis FlgM
MKIDNGNQMVLLNNLAKPSSLNNGSDVQSSSQQVLATGDKVELSGWKDEVNTLKEQVKAMPDVDEDKVARVKQALDSGTYNAKGQIVARGILKSQLLDEIL